MRTLSTVLLLPILFQACAESTLDQSQLDDPNINVLDVSFSTIQYGGNPFGGVQVPPNQDQFQENLSDMRQVNQGDMHAQGDMNTQGDMSTQSDQLLVDQSIDMMTPDPIEDMQVTPPDPLAACPRIRVVNTGVDGLRIRPLPNRTQDSIGIIPDGTQLDVLQIVTDGEDIMGNNDWYQVRYNHLTGYVSAYFCQCLAPPDPNMAPEDFRLPFTCGSRYRVTQGNNGSVSHSGRSAYGFDFGMSLNTPMLAMRAGVVRHTRDATGPGDNCYSGGGPECRDFANYVVLEHNDGTGTAYVHLNRVDVQVGQQIEQGQQLGLSGSTGYSTGPHAHVERQQLCASRFCQSIEMRFADVDVHGGIPQEDEWVVSGNCP